MHSNTIRSRNNDDNDESLGLGVEALEGWGYS